MRKIVYLLMLLSVNCFAQKTIDLAGSLSKSSSLPLSKIATEIRYIPLETSDECLLSNELQIYQGKNDIFVGDQQTMKFYRFDKSGKLLNVIGEKGDGPEEYPYALNFYVDEKNEHFYVIGMQTKTLYVYTYEGKFLKKVTLENVGWTINMLGNNIISYNPQYNRIRGKKNVAELYLFDTEGKELKKHPTTIRSEEDDMLLFDQPFFYRYGNDLFYKNAVSDVVYQIKEGLSMVPHYKIPSGSKHGKDDYKNIRKYAEKLAVRHIIETGSWTWVIYVNKNEFECLAYDKHNNSCFNVREGGSPGFKDDLTDGPLFMPAPTANSHGGYLLAWKEAGIAMDEDLNKKYDSLKGLTADDNPILVVVKLK